MEIQAQHKKKDVKETLAKILPSTLSKHCICTIFVVKSHWQANLQVEKLNISGYSVKLPVRVL